MMNESLKDVTGESVMTENPVSEAEKTATAIAAPEAPSIGTGRQENNSNQLKQEREIQDNKLLEELDKVLAKHQARTQPVQRSLEQPKLRQITHTVTKNGVGFISLGLVLIFLGVMLLYCLFSPRHDFFLVLKLSPICLLLIGLEILLYQIFSRGKFKVNVPSIVISAFVIIGCCVMSSVFNEKFNENNNEYNNRSIAAEIYDMSYDKLKNETGIAKLDVKVDLNPVSSGEIKGVTSLSTDDYVDITVSLSGIIDTPKDFAVICKRIIQSYKSMGINVTNFYFNNESALHTYNLKVEGKFAQDSSGEELEKLVNHIYIRDMDYLQDLEDLTDDTESN